MRFILFFLCFNSLIAQKSKLDSMFIYKPSCDYEAIKVHFISRYCYVIPGYSIDNDFNLKSDGESYSLSILGENEYIIFQKSLLKAKDLYLKHSDTAKKNNIEDFNLVLNIELPFSANFTYYGQNEISLKPNMFFVFDVNDGVCQTKLVVLSPKDLNGTKKGNSFIIPFCNSFDFDRLLEIISIETMTKYHDELNKYYDLFKD